MAVWLVLLPSLLAVVLVQCHGQQLSPLEMPSSLFADSPVPNKNLCPYHPATVDLPNPLPSSIINNINEVLQFLKQQVLNTNYLPGIAYSLTYKDKVLLSGGLGVTSKTATTVPSGSTIFRIGSVSKVFATMVMYQLYDQGHVKSLDDNIQNYCPNFKIQTQFNITLRQLASQMSGLPREAPCGTKNNLTNFCATTTKDVLNNLQNQRVLSPPWTTPSYSNLAFALLGHCLVESLTPSTTYEQYVQRNILVPLNMTSTGFQITDSVKMQMATGYKHDGSVAPLTDLGWLGPAGQMYSTTDDLNKLIQFFTGDYQLASAAVLSPTIRKQMLLPVFVNRDTGSGFGTPWEILFESNYTILTKGGYVAGYGALFSFVPELKLGLNMLFTGATNKFSIAQVAYNLLIPVFIEALKPLQKAYPYPPNPSVYEGTYNITGPEGVSHLPNVIISTYNKQLVGNILGASYYLSYQDNLLLQIEYDASLLPCLNGEVVAAKGEWLYFAPGPANGPSPMFTIPGLYTGLTFNRLE